MKKKTNVFSDDNLWLSIMVFDDLINSNNNEKKFSIHTIMKFKNENFSAVV
mgnify:CR=1 FL=1